VTRNYYEILGIQAGATSEEIHKAYRSLAMVSHPDRNSTPGADSNMAMINEAYSILSDPALRKRYDQEQIGAVSAGIAGPILSAACDTLFKQGWIVTQNDGKSAVLEQGLRAVRVTFIERLDNTVLKKIGRQFAGFSVVLALHVETPINLSFHTAVIDLMHSRRHGAAFPDESYRLLFAPFLAPNA
jgi:curved DNA-binding protein CbpA